MSRPVMKARRVHRPLRVFDDLLRTCAIGGSGELTQLLLGIARQILKLYRVGIRAVAISGGIVNQNLDSAAQRYPVNLFVVEDDPGFRQELVNRLLSEQDFKNLKISNIGQAGNRVEALEAIRSSPPDLVILDDCIPARLGVRATFQAREIIDELREGGFKTPVLVITALQDSAPFDESDMLRMCGSIDYVNKLSPDLFRLVLAKTKNLLMRTQFTRSAKLIVGPWLYDQQHSRLRLRADAGVKNFGRYTSRKLAPKEASILNHLLTVGGRSVTKSELLKSVWGQNDYNTNTVATTVGRLRASLSIEGWPNSIVFVPGKGGNKAEPGGYRLNYQAAPARMQAPD